MSFAAEAALLGVGVLAGMPARGLRVFVGICGLAVAIRLGVSAY